MAKKNDAIESMPTVKNKKRVWLLITLSTMGLCLLGGGAYFYLTQNTIVETLDASDFPETVEAIDLSVVPIKSSEFFNSKSEPEVSDLIYYELKENIITVLAETDYEMQVRLALFIYLLWESHGRFNNRARS